MKKLAAVKKVKKVMSEYGKGQLNIGRRVGAQGFKLPSLAEKYYTRSCFVRNFY